MLTFSQREHWHSHRKPLNCLTAREKREVVPAVDDWADDAVREAVLRGHMERRYWVKPERGPWWRRVLSYFYRMGPTSFFDL